MCNTPAITPNSSVAIGVCTTNPAIRPLSKVSNRLNMLKAFMLTFCFLTLGVFGGNYAHAQGGAREGTYQFIFPSERSEVNVSLSETQLQAVETMRKENEVVYAVSVTNDYIRVKILPRSVINSADFKPAPRVIYKADMSEEERRTMRYLELP